MATTQRRTAVERDYKKWAEEIHRQGQDAELQAQWLEELRQTVAHYEATFGIPSEEVHEAIDDGRLHETLEVCDWIMDYNLLQRVLAKKG